MIKRTKDRLSASAKKAALARKRNAATKKSSKSQFSSFPKNNSKLIQIFELDKIYEIIFL